jgi:hypothetical protein
LQELNKIEGSLEFEMEQDSNSNFIEDIKKQLMLAPSEEINKKKSKKTKESFTGESILLKMYLESSLCKGNNKLKTVKGELFTTTVNNFQGKTESMSIVITQICKDFIKIPTDKIKKFWHQTGNNFVIILHNEKLEKNEGYIRSKVVGSYSKVK